MPMMMWNMTTFPIERLCFDLKLKVLEELDAKDVIELVKVNQGFQWMISNRPSIVFGHHVDDIEFGFDPHGMKAIKIKKLNSESRGVSLDVIRHFPFIKNIRSCNQLRMRNDYDAMITPYRQPTYDMDKDSAAFLKQLEVVNSLGLDHDSVVHLDLLSHLSMRIKSYAYVSIFLRKFPAIKDLVGQFIETPLNECKTVRFACQDDDEFQFYYNALIKTHIECVVISGCDENLIVPAIQRVLSHGIPSKNPAAVLGMYHHFVHRREMKATILVFLKGYPGMKQIYGKNRQPFIALGNDSWNEGRYPALTMKTLCFRRNINATRDCIYMLSFRKLNAKSHMNFFACYIKPDEMIDH